MEITLPDILQAMGQFPTTENNLDPKVSIVQVEKLWFSLTLDTCAKSLQSRPVLCDAMDCSLAGSSVHGILQARMLEWVAMLSSRGASWPKIETAPLATPELQEDSLLLSHQGSPTLDTLGTKYQKDIPI